MGRRLMGVLRFDPDRRAVQEGRRCCDLAHGTRAASHPGMRSLAKLLARAGLLKGDFDYHLLRASMVLIFLFFGYQKWFAYEAQALIPFISHGPLISWMYPVFGIRGACWFLGAVEWLTAGLLLLGFWDKRAG